MNKRKVRCDVKAKKFAKPAKFAKNRKSTQKKSHDSFFKTAFKEPKRTAELLRFAAKRNKSLAEFIDAVDLSSMKPLPTEGTRIDLSCASDLSFCVRLKSQPTQTAELLVGVVLEHKSFPDNDVLYQLEKYFFELVRKVDAERPMVAIIVYNGKEKWVPEKIRLYSKYPEYFRKVGLPFRLETIDVGNELPHIEMENLDPAVMLALVAMKYAFDADKYRETFDEALQYVLKQDSRKLRSFIEEVYVYLYRNLSGSQKEKFMDRPEIVANKGYKSIADVLFEEGEAAARESMQPLLDAANARADRERERAEKAEALLRKYGCLI